MTSKKIRFFNFIFIGIILCKNMAASGGSIRPTRWTRRRRRIYSKYNDREPNKIAALRCSKGIYPGEFQRFRAGGAGNTITRLVGVTKDGIRVPTSRRWKNI